MIINRIYVLEQLACLSCPARLRGDLARLLGVKLVAPVYINTQLNYEQFEATKIRTQPNPNPNPNPKLN